MVPILDTEQQKARSEWWERKFPTLTLPSAGNKEDLLQSPRVIERYGRLMWIKLLTLVDAGFRRMLLQLDSMEGGPFTQFMTQRNVPLSATSNLDVYEAAMVIHFIHQGAKRSGLNFSSAVILASNEWGWSPDKKTVPVRWMLNNSTDKNAVQGWFWYTTMETIAQPLLTTSSLGAESVLAFLTYGWPTAPWYYMAVFLAAQKRILSKSKIAYDDSLNVLMRARNDYGVGEEAILRWPIRSIYTTQAGMGNPSWFGFTDSRGAVTKRALMSYKPKNWGGRRLVDYITYPTKFESLELNSIGLITGQGDGSTVPIATVTKLLMSAYQQEWTFSMFGRGGGRSEVLSNNSAALSLRLVDARAMYERDLERLKLDSVRPEPSAAEMQADKVAHFLETGDVLSSNTLSYKFT